MLLEKMREQYGAEPDQVFNLSHSGSYVLCSISTEKEAKVGCDIETIKETRMRVARRFFLPAAAQGNALRRKKTRRKGSAAKHFPDKKGYETEKTHTLSFFMRPQPVRHPVYRKRIRRIRRRTSAFQQAFRRRTLAA